MEIDADLLIKATKVDGVYAEDPHDNPNAERFDRMTYMQALELRVGVMDATAISLCMENDLPIIVLSLWQPHSLEKAVRGEDIGTYIAR
jgi:uridylate kinase